jgi:hypothetical protein
MTAQALFGFDQIPWGLMIPVTAGLAATGMAFVLSRFLLSGARRPPTPPSEPSPQPAPGHDPFVAGSQTEQRAAHRRGGHPISVQLTPQGHEGPVTRGWVVDRSMGGLLLMVDDAVPVGTVSTVRAIKASTTTPGVDIEIKSCRQMKDQWELGCRFVKTPPWSVLLSFG